MAGRISDELDRLTTIDDIHEMLIEGDSPLVVARYVQNTLKKLDGFSLEAVRDELKARAEKLLESGAASPVEKLGAGDPVPAKTSSPHRYAKKLYGRLALASDPLVESSALFLAQRDRIAAMMEEDPTNPDLYREFEAARRLLESQVKFMKDFGIISERGKNEEVGVDLSGANASSRTAEVFQDPKRRQKVIEALRALVDSPMLPQHEGGEIN